MQEIKERSVWSLGGKDPLEEGMATHSSILAWRIPWTEKPGRLGSTGSRNTRHDLSDLALTLGFSFCLSGVFLCLLGYFCSWVRAVSQNCVVCISEIMEIFMEIIWKSIYGNHIYNWWVLFFKEFLKIIWQRSQDSQSSLGSVFLVISLMRILIPSR